MRRSLQFLLIIAASLFIFMLLPLHAFLVRETAEAELSLRMKQLSGLQLTDLCLSTEARYTRHPALADRHAPFQEHPAALEHFPSGSIILPSLHSRETP